MITTESTTENTTDAERRRQGGLAIRVLASIAVLGVALGLVSIASLALFTDSDAVPNNSFATGSVVIDATPDFIAFNVTGMDPGDEEVSVLNVANAAASEFRYAVTSATSEDVLASDLVLTIRENVVSCTTANWDATGTQVYTGILGDSTTPGGHPLLGDATQGNDTGDRVLASSANEDLCFHVTLPLSSTAQNTTTTATFNFLAEQTSNNP